MENGLELARPMVHGMTAILEVQNLHVAYYSRSGAACPALAGVHFDLAPGEILGVLGESGSGKSTLASSLLRLLPPNAKIQQGKVLFEGTDLLAASPQGLRAVRGGSIGLILQEPSSALHPALTIRKQVREVLAAHESSNRRALDAKVMELLASVFPDNVERIARAYPHELSGGQRQRVLIAQAIACSPSLIIADEPTASLDPTTQREILQLFRGLQQKLSLAVIWITHSPALLAGFANRILVVYAGRVAEIGPADEVLYSPRHPYTQALLRCLPPELTKNENARKAKLNIIAGDPPDLSSRSNGCLFEPRCAEKLDICKRGEPSAAAVSKLHGVACYKFLG